jgi:lipopolysaccharide export system permease protein
VPDDVLATEYAAPAKAVPTLTLLREPTRANKAELAWRIGLALAAVNLRPDRRHSARHQPAQRARRQSGPGLAHVCRLLQPDQSGADLDCGGRIGMGAYLLILHGGAFALAVGWIASRHQNWSLAALWRPRSRNAAAISS